MRQVKVRREDMRKKRQVREETSERRVRDEKRREETSERHDDTEFTAEDMRQKANKRVDQSNTKKDYCGGHSK